MIKSLELRLETVAGSRFSEKVSEIVSSVIPVPALSYWAPIMIGPAQSVAPVEVISGTIRLFAVSARVVFDMICTFGTTSVSVIVFSVRLAQIIASQEVLPLQRLS